MPLLIFETWFNLLIWSVKTVSCTREAWLILGLTVNYCLWFVLVYCRVLPFSVSFIPHSLCLLLIPLVNCLGQNKYYLTSSWQAWSHLSTSTVVPAHEPSPLKGEVKPVTTKNGTQCGAHGMWTSSSWLTIQQSACHPAVPSAGIGWLPCAQLWKLYKNWYLLQRNSC